MARIIDYSTPYVLQETGPQVEKVLGMPYRYVTFTDAERAMLRENIGHDIITYEFDPLSGELDIFANADIPDPEPDPDPMPEPDPEPEP